MALVVAPGGCSSANSGAGNTGSSGGSDGGNADGGKTDSGSSSDGSSTDSSGSSEGGTCPTNTGSPPTFFSSVPPSPSNPGENGPGDTLFIDDLDVYAVSGNRLYYLSNYRGLLVFDVTDVDHPVLLGSSPIAGSAQSLYASGNQVTLLYSDVYETTAQGTPFHGSAVRVVDCTDPTHVQQLGEVTFAGVVQESRLVGSVLYAVGTSHDAPYGSFSAPPQSPNVFVVSIDLSAGAPRQIDQQNSAGDDGLFAFGPGSVLVYSTQNVNTASVSGQLQYVDISDPAGAIKFRGAIGAGVVAPGPSPVNLFTAFGSIDFADGVHAHLVGAPPSQNAYAVGLVTVDFTNPDAPMIASTVANLIGAHDQEGVLPLFDVDPTAGRAVLYVGHSGGMGAAGTSIDVYDLSNPASPKLAAGGTYLGSINSLQRTGNSLLTLSNASTSVADFRQFDVTNPLAMNLIGSVELTGTPDRIVVDPTGTLALAPGTTIDVVALGSMTPPSGAGTVTEAITQAMFVQGRAYVMSAHGVTIFDVSQPTSPRQTGSLAFSSYVTAVQPMGSVLAVISNDPSLAPYTGPTDVRIVPVANATDPASWAASKSVSFPSLFPEIFSNGSLLYIESVNTPTTQRAITVVDATSGAPVIRGSVSIPDTYSGSPFATEGDDYGVWFNGPDGVQVAATTLAIRGGDVTGSLHIVDLANPDKPSVASVSVVDSSSIWWGNLLVLGGTLYVTTVDPEPGPACSITPNVPLGPTCQVAYRLVPIDLHDPAHPCAGVPINVPGVAFGASTQDPSIVYFVEYSPGLGTGTWANEIHVGKLAGNDCTVQGTLSLSDLVGQPYVQNDGATVSVGGALHHLDLTNPAAPVDTMLTGPYSGWGTLVSLDGDVALVASGWGRWNDVYVLGGSNTPPAFVQTARPPLFASLDSPGVRLSGKRQGTTVYYPAGDFGVAAVVAP